MKRIDKRGYVRFTEDPTRTAWEHIRVAEKKLGRTLGKYERVHHINGDKTDNREENLLVMRSEKDHRVIHSYNGNIELFQSEDGSTIAIPKQYECRQCHRLFQPSRGNMVFCSVACSMTNRASRIPDAAILAKQVWDIPTSSLAAIYGVSDRAIGKWCKKMGLSKPPRGYWTKKKFGVL